MIIETRFDIGDTVLAVDNNSICDLKVVDITYHSNTIFYRLKRKSKYRIIRYHPRGPYLTLEESDCYATREEMVNRIDSSCSNNHLVPVPSEPLPPPPENVSKVYSVNNHTKVSPGPKVRPRKDCNNTKSDA